MQARASRLCARAQSAAARSRCRRSSPTSARRAARPCRWAAAACMHTVCTCCSMRAFAHAPAAPNRPQVNLHVFGFELMAPADVGFVPIRYRRVACAPVDPITIHIGAPRVRACLLLWTCSTGMHACFACIQLSTCARAVSRTRRCLPRDRGRLAAAGAQKRGRRWADHICRAGERLYDLGGLADTRWAQPQ